MSFSVVNVDPPRSLSLSFLCLGALFFPFLSYSNTAVLNKRTVPFIAQSEVSSLHYHLVAADLRDTVALERKLYLVGIDKRWIY